ncbi:MAG: PorT family protein [Flavobacteriales bacterium]|nr:PorT family protein [Flavobacteriales bacterium]
MRLISSLFITLFCVLNVQAQFGENPILNLRDQDEQLLSWGFYLGFNSYHFQTSYNQAVTAEIQTDKTIGFNVGLVGDLRMSDYMNLRFEPGLSSNTRSLTFPNLPKPKQTREVQSTYIHFPLLLKISTKRKANIKPFIVGGLSTSLNLSSNEDSLEDNSTGKFRTTKFTNYYELGIGVDLYLEYFKFTPSLRGVFSTGDELIRDKDPNSEWTGNISEMKTRGVFINFTFQ